MKIEISYMSGAGNLFTVIDNSKHKLSLKQASKLAPILCGINQYNSFKTEGLILIDTAENDYTDFSAHFFNPDGSNDAMCGNGGRCAVAFANQIASISTFRNYSFSMAGGTYNFQLEDELISLFFPAPHKFESDTKVKIDTTEYWGTFVDVGSKHFVLDISQFSEIADSNFREFDIMQIAPPIRYAKEFAPNGVNVNIYKIEDNKIQLRTYERGVEFETGACGTGAISTALSVSKLGLLQFPITIVPPSEIELIVDCKIENDTISTIILKGPAEIIKTLKIDLSTYL